MSGKIVKELQKRVDDMEGEIKRLRKSQKKDEKKDRPKKPPSEYNIFVKTEIAKQKKILEKAGKSANHRDLFSNAVKAWSNQKK